MKHLSFYCWLLSILIPFKSLAHSHGETLCIESLGTYLNVDAATLAGMHKKVPAAKPKPKKIKHSIQRPFFTTFPSLQKQIPLVELADLPTPIIKAQQLSKQLHSAAIYI